MAADLEQAAAEALEKVRALAALTDKAHGRLTELEADIESAAQDVESDWTRFVEQGQALLDKAGEVNERVGTESAEARGAVATLGAALGQAGEDSRANLETARENTLSVGKGFETATPDATALADSVKKASEELSKSADQVETALREALEAAREFVAETVTKDLEQLQDAVAGRAQQLTLVMTQCAEQLQTSYDHWDAGLTEVETEVAEAFEETETHMTTMVETAVTLARQAFLDPLAALASEVQEIEKLLEDVAEAATEAKEAAAGAADEASAAMDEDRAGFEAVKAKLDEVKALLASFSFVEM
jgi:hypothetical protein